jgi:protein-disulfide isomerase
MPVLTGSLTRAAALLSLLTGLALYAVAGDAQAQRVITGQMQVALASRPETPAAGSKDADVTIIEFLDYNCPFCKKTAPELLKLLRADPKVRILIKEWPIFGAVSEYAARSALAANWQGKFIAAHNALMGSRADLDETSQVDAVLNAAGIDVVRLANDRTRHAGEIDVDLARYSIEAKRLGLVGTPGFVIGRQLISRALTLEALQQLTAGARTSG